MQYNISEIAKMIDHSLLHPTMTDEDLEKGVQQAIQYQTASVCIKPYAVKKCAEWLKGTDVLVCTVIGFPHGSHTTDIKVAETKLACEQGCHEIDMVVNIGKVLSGDWDYVANEIRQINAECLAHGASLKVIFENDYLKDEHKIKLCSICSDIPVAFVKSAGLVLLRLNIKPTFEDVTVIVPVETPHVGGVTSAVIVPGLLLTVRLIAILLVQLVVFVLVTFA